MEIKIEWRDKNFNINLHTSPDKDAFLSIKGCRLVGEGEDAFIGFPARKNEQTGKWWNHVWGSDEFQGVVIKKAIAAKEKPKAPKKLDELDDDIPF